MKTENDRIPMHPGIYRFCVTDEEQIMSRHGQREREAQKQENQETGGEDERSFVRVKITGLLSDQGATCLTYEGTLPDNGRKVIVKEFYPGSTRNVWGISRGGEQKLHIPGMVWRTDSSEPTEITGRLCQFLRSYEWQRKFYSDPRFLEIVVEPQYLAAYGDTYYIISDFHNGKSMREKLESFEGLKDKLFLLRYLADLMMILEENGFLLLDISLDNFLVIEQTANHHQLRLFDLDSILDLNELDGLHQAEGNIFYHEEYAPREIRELDRLLRRYSFDDIKKDYIEKSAAVYSLGVLFFRILFGYVPDQKERLAEDCRGELERRLTGGYNIALDMADELLGLLKNMLSGQCERYESGFYSCGKVLGFLNEFSRRMHYEEYISQSEMAGANATFAAYNMLQKFPLFHYTGGGRTLRAAFAGNHMMREEFLSAFLSIGQMLDFELELAVVSPDAGQFWNNYMEQNPGLRRAVLAEIDGKKQPDETDRNLIGSPLARIRILNVPDGAALAEKTAELYDGGYRYFVLLEPETDIVDTVRELGEAIASGGKQRAKSSGRPKVTDTGSGPNGTENSARAGLSGAPDGDGRVCVGCLQRGSSLSVPREYGKYMDIHLISGRNVSEMYSEKMYGEQIYRMGLMAHAYYKGYLGSASSQDADVMKEIEEDYKKNIYNRLSSERAALHGIYKMASVGIDVGRPGRFRAYFEKLQDEQTVEKLGWLEHRSWTAYMLSAGNVPVSVSEMDSYAYQWGNDWKDRRDPHRIRHPLLAASEPERRLPRDGWKSLTKEEISRLDPLDQVSFGIYQWYRSRRPAIQKEISALFAGMPAVNDPEMAQALCRLQECSRDCAKRMGERPSGQDLSCFAGWDQAMKNVQDHLDEGRAGWNTASVGRKLDELKGLMKPVRDSCGNRDFKQLDRDIVYSVLDMISV